MTKPTGQPVGRPPISGETMNKSLGSVYVTKTMLDEFSKAAEFEGVSRAEWIRAELVKSAKRVRKKHNT